MDGGATYSITWIEGEKRFEPREYVRLIMPRAKWWQWRYKRERAEMARLAESYGMRLHEA